MRSYPVTLKLVAPPEGRYRGSCETRTTLGSAQAQPLFGHASSWQSLINPRITHACQSVFWHVGMYNILDRCLLRTLITDVPDVPLVHTVATPIPDRPKSDVIPKTRCKTEVLCCSNHTIARMYCHCHVAKFTGLHRHHLIRFYAWG